MMTKLIYGDSFPELADVGMRLVEDPAQMRKQASTVFGCNYDDVKPDKDHVGIHLVALGDYEHYSANRNGDTFPKAACVKYHHTFVKNAKVHRHHKNRPGDPVLGKIVKSAYNEPMGRIELFIHADKKEAAPELQKFAEDGEVPYSMSCSVKHDRCTICNTVRKNAQDPRQCEHVKNALGKLLDDGRVVATHNDEPNWFEISFVTRPADRIAWSLKAASADIVSSVELAQQEGILTPDVLALDSELAERKYRLLQKMAATEQEYRSLVNCRPTSLRERYLVALEKSAAPEVPESLLAALRPMRPSQAFDHLVKVAVMMPVASFMRYTFGPDGGEMADKIAGVQRAVRGLAGRLLKQGGAARVCNDERFEPALTAYSLDPRGVGIQLAKQASAFSIRPEFVEQRSIDRVLGPGETTLDIPDEKEFNVDVMIEKLAEAYVAYQLSSLTAILDRNTGVQADTPIAAAVVQNLTRQ